MILNPISLVTFGTLNWICIVKQNKKKTCLFNCFTLIRIIKEEKGVRFLPQLDSYVRRKPKLMWNYLWLILNC